MKKRCKIAKKICKECDATGILYVDSSPRDNKKYTENHQAWSAAHVWIKGLKFFFLAKCGSPEKIETTEIHTLPQHM